MKKILSSILLLYLLVGCGVVKKTAISASTEVSTSKTSTDSSSVSTFVDTTKTGSSTISIIKIEFYPDEIGPNPAVNDPEDNLPTDQEKVPETAPERPKRPGFGATINVGGKTISGNIKSAEIIEINKESKTNGVSESKTETQSSESSSSESSSSIEKTETPQKDPRRFLWLAILVAVSLIAILVVYVKFIKPLNLGGWISKILGKFGGLLKNN